MKNFFLGLIFVLSGASAFANDLEENKFKERKDTDPVPMTCCTRSYTNVETGNSVRSRACVPTGSDYVVAMGNACEIAMAVSIAAVKELDRLAEASPN